MDYKTAIKKMAPHICGREMENSKIPMTSCIQVLSVLFGEKPVMVSSALTTEISRLKIESGKPATTIDRWFTANE